MPFQSLRDQALSSFRLRKIEGEGEMSRPFQAGDSFRQGIAVNVAADNMSAKTGEQFSGRGAEAARRAGNDRDAPGQAEIGAQVR